MGPSLRWWGGSVASQTAGSRPWDEPRTRLSGACGSGLCAGVESPAQTKEPGPVAHGSVVAPGAPGPASYLLVGTPLPMTVLRATAMRGSEIAFFTMGLTASGNRTCRATCSAGGDTTRPSAGSSTPWMGCVVDGVCVDGVGVNGRRSCPGKGPATLSPSSSLCLPDARPASTRHSARVQPSAITAGCPPAGRTGLREVTEDRPRRRRGAGAADDPGIPVRAGQCPSHGHLSGTRHPGGPSCRVERRPAPDAPRDVAPRPRPDHPGRRGQDRRR